MKKNLLLLIFAFLSIVVIAQQTINIYSITYMRQASGDNGYTLDGVRMLNYSRAKLLDTNNFGNNGIYNKYINIYDDYELSGSLSDICSIPKTDIFFFGVFNKLDASLNQFSKTELDSLYKWSKEGGKLIIGASPYAPTYNYDPRILDSLWDFEAIFVPSSNFVPTVAGDSLTIFQGPFGNVSYAFQGGGVQAYFINIPSNVVVLAENSNGQPTMFPM